MSKYPHFRPGQKVRTKFGDIRTVRNQVGSQVFVEEPDINGWYDSGQLWLLHESSRSRGRHMETSPDLQIPRLALPRSGRFRARSNAPSAARGCAAELERAGSDLGAVPLRLIALQLHAWV
jgi:hypothetical protein